jgi:hypothetical protein
MKTCIKCGETKELSGFYKDNSNKKDRHQNKCKPCHEKVKFKSKVGAYGISVNEFYAMIEKQNNCCAICNKSLNPKKHTHIDHDHFTNKVRGILCHYCNTAIGLFKEDKDVMQKAIEYLSHYEIKNM